MFFCNILWFDINIFYFIILRTVEDKDMLDGQVSFLNSVIVDMQRKNEQLMARVQALEGGTIINEPPLL